MTAVPATAASTPAAAPADAIAAWHGLFEGSAGERLAAGTQEALDAQLARRGLVFGERALCTVLRPRLFTPGQYRSLARRIGALMPAFGAAHRAAVADAGVRAQFRLAEWEETLLAADPSGGRELASPTSRVDAFVVDTDAGGEGAGAAIALTEYNGEVPAGAAYNDALAEAFLDLPVTRAFARDWHVLPLPAHHGVVDALLRTWRRWSGRTHGAEVPRVAILDWDDVPTRTEFLLYQRQFEALGVPCVIADPRAAERRDGALWVDGAPVGLVYKRVLTHELWQRCGLEAALFQAWRAGEVCLVNPPPCKILHKKASLAVLTDERNAHLFDAAATAAIQACVPWTRVIEERHTVHHGASVDLVPHVLADRERFVLKPNDDYGGHGIVLGWTVDQGGWEAAVARALAEPYIVQERVAIPWEPYPSFHEGTLHVADRMIDTAPFVTDAAQVDGVLTRLSTAALLNVTAGGGSQVPSFVVVPR